MYNEFLNKVKDLEVLRESDYKNLKIQELLFDIDTALKDKEITYEQREYLFNLI
jgi:hypothetical protein